MIKAPPLNNDCFALPAGIDWTPVDDALDMLRERLGPVVTTKDMPIHAAAGRILARDVMAKRSNPPTPNTAVDGYGFAGGVDAGEHVLPLVRDRAAAGQSYSGTVPDGHAIRILTGATLPDGVETVVLDEDVNVSDTHVAFQGPLKRGANTRKAGEDACKGDIVLPKGRRLTAPDLGLLAVTGVAHVSVYTKLRVAVLSTGTEVTEVGQDGTGKTFDANRPMLCAMLARWGIEVIDLGIQPDDPKSIADALSRGAAQADAIITSGGASAGDEDHISSLLNQNGTMAAWRIALKPGRPLALGLWDGAPVFGLPGNPVAAWVCSLIFVRPALTLLAGGDFTHPVGVKIPAAFSKNKKPGRREYMRARITPDGRAEVFKSEGSGRISGLSWATGLVELPDGPVTVAEGDLVKFIHFSEFGV